MADKKISELTNITGANLADNDEFVVVDTSATETKAITRSELVSGIVTTAGVTAAGALMDSELTDITAVKALDQGVATTDDPTFTNTQLAEIAASKAVTAVDVFVYDTSKDSDGGAWRKRTQGTSWYNETLNTATRGSRREFPAVAVIVAEINKVTIYDGDDPALPMWMVFTQNTNVIALIREATLTCVSALNGIISFGGDSGTAGLMSAHFIDDFARKVRNASQAGPNTTVIYGPLADRSISAYLVEANASLNLVNTNVNDVAMTVLPDAPIDPATGLQVPTIAVATAGGVSVIKDNGTVVDLSAYASKKVVFFGENLVVNWGSGVTDVVQIGEIPTADQSISTFGQQYTNTVPAITTLGGSLGFSNGGFNNGIVASKKTIFGAQFTDANTVQPTLIHLFPDLNTKANGMVAYTTSTYNTGWQVGAIKGAFLSDTDDTDLVGGTPLDDDFSTYADTAALQAVWTVWRDATVTLDSGELLVTAGSTAYGGTGNRSFTTVVGKTYVVRCVVTALTGSGNVVEAANIVDGASAAINGLSVSSAGEYVFTFTATAATTYFRARAQNPNNTLKISDVEIKLADADRSVKNKGLIVNGTVTRTPVATGADLVAYSGFSASNYLEQPYNPDLDFGTGDFCVMGWVKGGLDGQSLLIRQVDGSNNNRFGLFTSGGNIQGFVSNGSGSVALVSIMEDTPPNFRQVVFLRRSGVLETYADGILVNTLANTYDITNTSANVFVGVNAAKTIAFSGSLALLRISATAPTASQIAKIYNDEKVLFQENAQATLYGSSDAVTALAHDDATGLLHVGTSAGRSVFQGLRRVSNTTTAVGTAISASNGLIVEE